MLKAGVVLSEDEEENISVADFGLGDLEHQGGQILTFFDTERISTKIIVLFSMADSARTLASSYR